MQIRTACAKDAEAVREIYAPYVAETAVSFEYTPPDTAEMARRIETTLKEYPWLVAEVNGRVAGYAYASSFHQREAYRHTAEVSIYLDRSMRGKGIGQKLYEALEAILLEQRVYVLYACVTATDRESDAYLTDASLCFHQRMGYRRVGCHALSGYKFGGWYSAVWLEKVIGERPEHPGPFIPFAQAR